MYIKQAFQFRHELWRYIIGFFIIFGGSQFIGSLPLIAALLLKGGLSSISNVNEMYQLLSPNFMLLLMLIPFALGMVFLIFWMKPVHNQPFKTLHSARGKLNWKKIWFSFILWGLITITFTVIDYLVSPGNYVWNFQPVPFLIMMIILLLLLPVQTSFEEYLFRGYLMQGLGMAARNKWVPLFVTSTLFGLMHIANPEVGKIGYMLLVGYIGTGFFLGIMTLMDDGLELALGFHAANNLFAAMLVTSDWTVFQTNSILKDVSEPSAGFDIFIPVFVVYPILLYIFSRKFGWTNWKEKLFGRLEPPVNKDYKEFVEQ